MSDPSSTHYEQRMAADLKEIRVRVEKVARRVEDQVGDAVHALVSQKIGRAHV